MKQLHSDKRGFTLIELLVVVSIISMLSSTVLSSVQNVRVKARDAIRELDTRQIINALVLIQDDSGKFPCHAYSNSSESNFLEPLIAAGYLSRRPNDPGSNYYYYTSFKTSVGGSCGQIAHLDIDFETTGRACPFGKFKTPTHCHVFYPTGIPCSDPYFSSSYPADCDALSDTPAENEY